MKTVIDLIHPGYTDGELVAKGIKPRIVRKISSLEIISLHPTPVNGVYFKAIVQHYPFFPHENLAFAYVSSEISNIRLTYLGDMFRTLHLRAYYDFYPHMRLVWYKLPFPRMRYYCNAFYSYNTVNPFNLNNLTKFFVRN